MYFYIPCCSVIFQNCNFFYFKISGYQQIAVDDKENFLMLMWENLLIKKTIELKKIETFQLFYFLFFIVSIVFWVQHFFEFQVISS